MGMRALKAAVIIMGVLIVAGVAVLAVALVQRIGAVAVPGGTPRATVTLDEPAGTHVAASSLSGELLALQLTGGGADRVVVFDVAHARVVGRVALAH